MIIINADDWGRSRDETDASLACYQAGRITSASAMVFMEDSHRAAELAQQTGLYVGLHLNVDTNFTGSIPQGPLAQCHDRVVRFSKATKYSPLIYHPLLRREFRCVFQAQMKEFKRLYGKPPTHIDGHHHKHLSLNVVLDRLIPPRYPVRRAFSFLPGEKKLIYKCYARLMERLLGHRYRRTDYLFSLAQCLKMNRLARVMDLAKRALVELQTHPINANEYSWLMTASHREMMAEIQTGTYAAI